MIGTIDIEEVRSVVNRDGCFVSKGLVPVELITEFRNFWPDTYANCQPEQVLVWTPYYGEPHGILFDRFRIRRLFLSYDYLWNSPQHGPNHDLALQLPRMRIQAIETFDLDGETFAEDHFGTDVTTTYYPSGGGYAEYIRLSTWSFIEIAEGVDHVSHPAGIGVVCDPVAMLLKVNKRARTASGEMVVVFGEIGGPGIHQVMLSKRVGVEHVIDAVANNVVEAVVGLTDSRGVDVAIDYVSSTTTLRQAFASLGVKGSIMIFKQGGKALSVECPGQNNIPTSWST